MTGENRYQSISLTDLSDDESRQIVGGFSGGGSLDETTFRIISSPKPAKRSERGNKSGDAVFAPTMRLVQPIL